MAKQVKPKFFNLERRKPQVLLVGNGLSYNSKFTWSSLIKNLAKNNEFCFDKSKIPYSIQASMIAPISDKERHAKYQLLMQRYEYLPKENIDKILYLPFDAILTTNYTYDIEDHLYNNFHANQNAQITHSCYTSNKSDGKYLIHNFNRICSGNQLYDIWHIHGEARRKSSMILTQTEYASLTNEILNNLKLVKNTYENTYTNMRFMSWIDYFILGDVYILGLSLDFTEFDLWMLLNRRNRENAQVGKIYFYAPIKSENQDICAALNGLGVQCLNLGYEKENDKFTNGKTYDDFYADAILDIKSKMKK